MRDITNKAELARALERGLGMTVRELKDELEFCDDDAVVLFACDYGDYHHTQQALPIGNVDSDMTSKQLAPSAYSHSGIELLETEDEDEDDVSENEKEVPIVILR